MKSEEDTVDKPVVDVNILMAKNLIDTNLDVYEKHMLSMCLWYPSFFVSNKKYILEEPDKKTKAYKCRDFTSAADNDIMEILIKYYLLFGDSDASIIPRIQTNFILDMVRSDVEKSVKTSMDLEDTRVRLNFLTDDPAPLLPVIQAGLGYWLLKKRSRALMVSELHTTTEVSSIVSGLETLIKKTATTGIKSVKFSHGIKETEDEVQDVIPSPLKVLNRAMGGGLARGDAMMYVLPQAGGKTVLATQYCDTLSALGYNVLFITTEQGVDELVPRVMACREGIPFDTLKNGIVMSRLDIGIQAKIRKTADVLDRHVEVWEWNDGSYNLANDTMPAIDELINVKGWRPDVLIVDWIGGGMGALNKQDLAYFRLLYQNTADVMVKVAKKYKLATITFAQASIGLAENKQKITGAMIAECKTLTRDYTWGVGISAIHEVSNDKTNPSTEKTYRDLQFAHFFKGRKSVGGTMPVLRNFKFQRFEDTSDNLIKK
jgi:archaellum biogenesis ATPase FlaH